MMLSNFIIESLGYDLPEGYWIDDRYDDGASVMDNNGVEITFGPDPDIAYLRFKEKWGAK